MRNRLMALSFAVLPVAASAQVEDFVEDPPIACTSPGTTVVFGNGMANSIFDALANMMSLQDLDLEEALEPTYPATLRYQLAYNYNEWRPQELFEIFLQRAEDGRNNANTFWEWMSDAGLAPPWFREYLLDVNARNMQDRVLKEEDLQKHLALYRREFQLGRRVVLVSHSQGNFYANNAYALLDHYERRGFGNFQVGTPTSFVAAKKPGSATDPYMTLYNDQVIHLLHQLTPSLSILPGNFNLGISASAAWADGLDVLFHSFLYAYMATPEARTHIRTNIIGQAQGLSYLGCLE